MTPLVVDASIAVKWVVSEDGTDAAVAILHGYRLLAPDLLVVECASVLRKKVQLGELTRDEALLAARLLQRAEIELSPMRHLMDEALGLAIDFEHPVYDCIYIALAVQANCRFVTADARLLRKIRRLADPALHDTVVGLSAAAR